MKKLLSVLFIILATFAFAEDMPEADAKLITELKEFCTEVAAEDGIGDMTMEMFMLKCVNQELEDEGFRPITKLN